MCAAIAAARRGVKTALIHDRPVLGGNASSEIRMHVCGAHGDNMRETGIIEEIRLENVQRNPNLNYSIWDSILYEKVRFEPNLDLFLNCSANSVKMDGDKLVSVTGWQGTAETWHVVNADLFADCSGDSILAPLSGAEFRIGREAESEFGEDIQPPVSDNKTMGMSCLIQFRETEQPQKFVPPDWAYVYESDDDMQKRRHNPESTNFWWIEVGGENDTIHETENLRDELLKIAFGVIDHIKNRGDHGADNWAVEWVGFLPGKRESRRYVGDHILTQNDVRAGGVFEDTVAYGGWSMDDHHPEGFYHKGAPTIFHPAHSPYGIPFRSLYSCNIENLLFAGRNISATHAAMSSTRVMATCALLGQAVGTSAAIAVRENELPRGVLQNHISELQQMLMDDDCYLPGLSRETGELSLNSTLSASEGNPEPLRNGINRPVGDNENGWRCTPGAWVEYDFGKVIDVKEARVVFDSDLQAHGLKMPPAYRLDMEDAAPPESLVKAFRLDIKLTEGSYCKVYETENNYHRLVRIPIDREVRGVRLTPLTSWGEGSILIQEFEVASR